MKIDGTCHCGGIAFEAEAEPGTIGICHCTDCQKLTGSAFRANVPATAGTFRIKRGAPRVYIKTADSGTRRAHAFCPDCGTPIYATAAEGGPNFSLRVGTINQRAALGEPRLQIWCDSALPWSGTLSGVVRRERQ